MQGSREILIENFIIDSSRNINSPKGFNLTDGSWFGSYKVDNEDDEVGCRLR
jgi:hypothetical protein